MKTLSALVFLFGMNANASSFKFQCEVKFNLQSVHLTSVFLDDANSSADFFETSKYLMKLSRADQSMTLEVLDREKDIRLYSFSNVHQISDKVALATWEREGMLDVICTVMQPIHGK